MLTTGDIVNGRYRVVRLIGQGGFGAVYRVWDLNLERPRALKENLETSPESRRQFKREAQLLGDLTHPNLTKVIDHFSIPDQGQYLVMEFVEGPDLAELPAQRGKPPAEAEALGWMIQICDAVDYLHSQDPPVIHRDIKPANIKIREDGRAMLVDFGISKFYDPQIKTTYGARAVTPGFSAQEQYGLGATDARTDIYALGATLYALLTGREPVESVQRTLNVEMPAPRRLNADISLSTEAVILRAMEMLPERRFQTMQEFRLALIAAHAGESFAQAERFSPPPQVATAAALNAAAFNAAEISLWGSAPVEPVSRSANASPTGPTTGAADAASTHLAAERPAWPLIAPQGAALALVGMLQFINETAYYIMDYLIEYSIWGFYTLTCILLLVDALVYRRGGSVRRFEILVGSLGILLPAYNFFIDRDDLAVSFITVGSGILCAALLWAALRWRDWRIGVLGAAIGLMTLQNFFIAVDNWDGLYAVVEVFAGFYTLAGLIVLVNTLTRR